VLALAVVVTGCGDGHSAPAETADASAEALAASEAQACTRAVTAAVADKLWVDWGGGRDNQERNQRLRTFAEAYLAAPEMEIFLRANSDGVNAINGGATVTEGIAEASKRAGTECATAYPE
jgi:hypothetical protein